MGRQLKVVRAATVLDVNVYETRGRKDARDAIVWTCPAPTPIGVAGGFQSISGYVGDVVLMLMQSCPQHSKYRALGRSIYP